MPNVTIAQTVPSESTDPVSFKSGKTSGRIRATSFDKVMHQAKMYHDGQCRVAGQAGHADPVRFFSGILDNSNHEAVDV